MITKQKTATNDDKLQALDEIQAPSVITELHVQDRETSKVAGAPRAWRKLTHLEAAYQQERLGARDSAEARSRFVAGSEYTRLWDTAQSAGRDSTAAFDSGRCMGSGLPLTLAQTDAIRRLVSIDLHLGLRDRAIMRALATGHSFAEAIGFAKLCKDTRVTARICESLDAVSDALDRTEKRKR